MDYAVEVENLTKVYGSVKRKGNIRALDDLTLKVPYGTVFGLLGPNGAGKTTLIKILLGIVHPTSGSAQLLNTNISKHYIRKNVGFLPENHKFPPYLTGEQVLRYIARLSGFNGRDLDKKISELLSVMKMSKWRKMKIKKYSKGMMQRIGLAQAMINDPKVIFLDEPTDGVDPIGRKEIRDILAELKNKGKTIFLNSHLLSEVELITDKIAILNNGVLVQEGTVADLTADKERYKISLGSNPSSIPEELKKKFGIEPGETKSFEVKVKSVSELNEIIDLLRNSATEIEAIIPQKNSLEDLFISLINKTETKKN